MKVRVDIVSSAAFAGFVQGLVYSNIRMNFATKNLPAWKASTIRHRLVESRKRQGFSAEYVAIGAGYGITAVSLWESARAVPSLVQIVDWSQFLGFELTLHSTSAVA